MLMQAFGAEVLLCRHHVLHRPSLNSAPTALTARTHVPSSMLLSPLCAASPVLCMHQRMCVCCGAVVLWDNIERGRTVIYVAIDRTHLPHSKLRGTRVTSVRCAV